MLVYKITHQINKIECKDLAFDIYFINRAWRFRTQNL